MEWKKETFESVFLLGKLGKLTDIALYYITEMLCFVSIFNKFYFPLIVTHSYNNNEKKY